MTGSHGVKCCVRGCHNSYEKGFRMFRVPTNKKLYQRNQWLQNADLIEDDLPKDARFCEVHFTLDQFERLTFQGLMGLKSNAVTTLFGNNLPKTVSAVREPELELNDENVIPELRSPLSNRNQCYRDQSEPLTPVSKRRKAHSVCEESILEMDMLKASLDDARRELYQCRKTAINWKKKCVNLSKNLSKFLNEDQIALLQLDEFTKNNKEWSDNTIKSSLQIRLMVKAKGYEFLRVQKQWPLPSFSVLKKRLQTLEFAPGPKNEILQYLPAVVIDPEKPGSEFCWLSWDEASIEQGVAYEKGLKQCLGLVTPELARNEEEKNTLAKKVVVFGLKVLLGDWKQNISFAFSGQNIDKFVLLKYIEELIRQAHAVGFKVKGISNDQGGGAMIWPAVKVSVTEKDLNVRSPHPVDGEPDLIWASVVAHIIKNFWVQLTKGDLKLPADVVQQHNLPSSLVSMSHVEELLNKQTKGARLVPKLNKTHIAPGKFEKMRVGFATYVFSEVVGNALKFLAEKNIISPEAETTGWFILEMAKWWKLMCNRQIFDSLGQDNFFAGRLEFLTNFRGIVDRSQFWDKAAAKFVRKPCKNALKMTTTSIIALHEVGVINGPLDYILTSKCTTSHIENTFSQLRDGGVQNPDACRARLLLRLISVGQFLHVNKYSSYKADLDEDHAIDFLKVTSRRSRVTVNEENELDCALGEALSDIALIDTSEVNLDFIDECGVYYMSGWAASKLKINCEVCIAAVKSPIPLEIAAAEWTEKMSWGGLSHPTAVLYNTLCVAEKIFYRLGSDVVKMKNPIDSIVIILNSEIPDDLMDAFPLCHNVFGETVKKFLRLRLHVATRDFSSEIPRTICYASKSAYKETIANNVAGRPR